MQERVKGELMEAKNSLSTVDEYVGKMRNRVELLKKKEEEMSKKIDVFNKSMEKRE